MFITKAELRRQLIEAWEGGYTAGWWDRSAADDLEEPVPTPNPHI